MFFVYKFFTWFVLILTALLGTTLTGFLLGAVTVAWLDEVKNKAEQSEYPIS